MFSSKPAKYRFRPLYEHDRSHLTEEPRKLRLGEVSFRIIFYL